MGGAKGLDGPENTILLCWEFNTAIESDPAAADLARRNGWKIDRFDPRPAETIPVLAWDGWRLLNPDGTYTLYTPPGYQPTGYERRKENADADRP
ncbi:hypothetical protein [Brevibacterium moorei]|uniref:hypothetical protein n=1 Tax=Brevibacterium moorei TaxID=2968457 RepID=UPI00211C9892|nr:hypothetical protein [Brevibacterium sp. 68QC2CO]MCQ9384395.1 hypothetical protein [Brevibacterium sp. 68QC2CO]